MQAIDAILSKLTVQEKIALCSGKNCWQTKPLKKYGVPSLFMCDGPHGLRKQDVRGGFDMLGVHASRPAVCFPTAVTLANSWDTALLAEIGAAIGTQAAAQAVGLVLGPGVNIKRDPLCGRNFEYFSEDPFLAGTLAAAYIRGVQATGVGACVKHFAANNQETSRFTSDSAVDMRTLREIYLAPFEQAVRTARPAAVMCAYNKLNSVHCSDHRWLLTDVLRREWGFDGLVVTDWGALSDRTAAFLAGCDLAMPGGNTYGEKAALAAVRTGTLPEKYIDDSARRVLTLVRNALRAQKAREQAASDNKAPRPLMPVRNEQQAQAASFEEILCAAAPVEKATSCAAAPVEKATSCAAAPVEKAASCAVASVKKAASCAVAPVEKAAPCAAAPVDEAAHHALARRAAEAGAVLLQNGGALPLKEGASLAVIGVLAAEMRYQGSGSSHINPTRLSQPLASLPEAVYAAGCDANGNTTDALLAEAADAARAAQTAVVFAGLPDAWESEGFDRVSLALPEGHVRMIETVAAENPNTVVVLMSGGVVECPWAEKVNAILYMGLPGQAGGEAAASLLYGRVNPSGKLAETWPLRYADCPTANCWRGRRNAEYREGIYVGYRYYDKASQPVRWPFGHGLSYTTFAYSDLRAESDAAYVTVANTGSIAGAEIVQLYIEPPALSHGGAAGAEGGRCSAYERGCGEAGNRFMPTRSAAENSCVNPCKTEGRHAACEQANGYPVTAGMPSGTAAGGQSALHRPVRELKGFAKVFLQPGESKTVRFSLPDRAFAVWADGWKTAAGVYTLRAGGSSRDLPLTLEITRAGEDVPAPAWQAGSWYERPQGTPTRAQWAPLIGALPTWGQPEKGAFTMDSTPLEMRRISRLADVMCMAAAQVIGRGVGTRDIRDPTFRMMIASSLGSPLRSMQISSGLPGVLFEALLAAANGRGRRGKA